MIKDQIAVEKMARLREILRKLTSVVVAYSGGVDSTFLMWVAADELGNSALAVTARSETYPEWESREAASIAERFEFRSRIVETSELAIPNFRNNPPERCYYCKSELFETLLRIAAEEGLRHVAVGATVSDCSDYRPGHKAARELGVVSPLLDAGLTKEEIRVLSRKVGLPTWNKPEFACLASRFPYYEEITEVKLSRVAKAEDFLRSLGIRQFRVRHHGNMARIEVDVEIIEMIMTVKRKKIARHFRSLGFDHVAVDLEGYRQGSLNASLKDSPEGKIQPVMVDIQK